MTHTMTLTQIKPLTHDTYALTFPKPDGLAFKPGQATMLAIQKDGWRDEERPFTFTSQPEDDDLEFVIKTYPDHDGMTEQVAELQSGDTVQMTKIWGAIEDKGPGVFIAGGAGITPFIPILRNRAKSGGLSSCTLIFAANSERDLIMKDEWDTMDGLNTRYVLADEDKTGFDHGHVDLVMLRSYVEGAGEGSHPFYICGPDPMIDAVRDNLVSLGVSKDRIVTEDGH